MTLMIWTQGLSFIFLDKRLDGRSIVDRTCVYDLRCTFARCMAVQYIVARIDSRERESND